MLAGVAALFTFAGTEQPTGCYWVAILFGICVYLGASLLRLLSIRAEALPLRWGYFRLAPALGLLFSAGLALLSAAHLLPAVSVADIGWKIIFEMPTHPSIEQVSELLFQIKQAFDDFIVTVLSVALDAKLARLIGDPRQRQRAVGVRERALCLADRGRRAPDRGRAAVRRGEGRDAKLGRADALRALRRQRHARVLRARGPQPALRAGLCGDLRARIASTVSCRARGHSASWR